MTAITLACPNVPREALPKIAEQLRAFGADIQFQDEMRGIVQHASGVIEFEHAGDILYLRVTKHAGHFPRLLLIGGMRQLVYETVEAMA
jgi:hypothetical protein